MAYKLFDFLNDLNFDKKHLLNSDPNAVQDMTPFIIKRGMSMNLDTVMVTNEMNKFGDCSKEMLYDFLFHIIPKKKRYGKWPKKSKSKDVDLLIMHYGVNRNRAEEYISLLSTNELDGIKQMYYTGGK